MKTSKEDPKIENNFIGGTDMTIRFAAGTMVAVALSLAGCTPTGVPNTGAGVLATQANLSPDAIRLQSAQTRILSLAEQQREAANRVRNFAIQGGLAGAAGGGLIGNLSCVIGGSECSSTERRNRTIAGAAGGAAIGAAAGANQGRRQNLEAERETALLSRIRIAGEQYDEARAARRLAEQVAIQNQNKLAQIRAQVAAGQADRGELQIARADARADANVIEAAVRSMNTGKNSVSGEASLQSQQNQLAQEEVATTRSLNALRTSIANSAL